ncbi:MAG: hypothetical protein ABEI98_04780 [Halorhabdus sp.]
MPSALLLGSAALLIFGVVFGAARYLTSANEADDPNNSASETAADATDTIRSTSWLGGAKAVGATVAIAPLAIIAPLLSALPATWRLWHKLSRWSLWQMQKASNADAIANVRLSNGNEDFRPAKWTVAEDDEKESTGWKIKGLKDRYDPAVHDQGSNRMGRASLIHTLEDAPELASWAEPAIDNALQLGREGYLFTDADLYVGNVTVDAQGSPQAVNGQPTQARADGGQGVDFAEQVSIDRPGIAQDALIPLASRDGFGGQVVSWGKYQTLKTQQADQDKIKDAKNRAWAAAKLDDIEGRDLLKLGIIVGIWSFILLFHQDIGAFIAGLSGGGGGGGAGSAVGNALGMISLGLGGV